MAQFSQNFALGEFSCWHRGHCMRRPSQRVEAETGRTGAASLVSRTGGVKDRGRLPCSYSFEVSSKDKHKTVWPDPVRLTPQAFCVTPGHDARTTPA